MKKFAPIALAGFAVLSLCGAAPAQAGEVAYHQSANKSDFKNLSLAAAAPQSSTPMTLPAGKKFTFTTSSMDHFRDSTEPALRTDQVPCGNRIDWYRIINTDTKEVWCFASDGEYDLHPSLKANLLCPGQNTGRVLRNVDGRWWWTQWRDGYGDNNRCYSFDRITTLYRVSITH